MNMISQLKTVVVMWVTLMLILGIADAFFDMKKINDLIFHSLIFHLAVFAVCWVLVLIGGKLIGPKRDLGR
jgi:hypothetical protein